jgi:hypothetical protein
MAGDGSKSGGDSTYRRGGRKKGSKNKHSIAKTMLALEAYREAALAAATVGQSAPR